MNADLERVVALQKLDTAVLDAERRIAAEPERRQALDARLEAARQRVDAAKERLAASQSARRSVEKDLGVHQGRLSKYREQLMSVKTNVEYQAMQKEIEFAQSEIKDLEDKILERMLEADELVAALKTSETELAALHKQVEAEKVTLTGELEELKSLLVRMAGERQELVGTLDPHVMATFELVSRRRNGIAVAEALDGICTICHVRLRPQVFNTVRRNDQIVQCDSCNRILFFRPVTPSAPADPIVQPTP
jgi:predicted  nucleic acid-binding Zn-ribbon protein